MGRSTVSGFLLAWAFMLLVGAERAVAQEGRKPVPDSAAQKTAKASILEVFKEEYRQRSSTARRDLAQKLLEQSKDTAGDVPTLYVLLDEAQNLAVEGGECTLAVQAIRALAKHFEVDGADLEYDALSRLRRKAKTVADHKVLAKAFLDLAGEAMRMESFETARRAVSSGGTSARSAKDINLVNRAKAKAKDVSSKKRAFEKIARARKTLEKSPNDAAANTVVGRYECFERGNWEQGLPMLQKGADKVLAQLAAKDLAEPSDADEAVAVGDGWWEQAEGQEWAVVVLLHARAANAYERVVGELAGLNKTRVEKRLAQYREELLGPAELWQAVEVSGGSKDGDVVTLTTEGKSANSAALKVPAEPVDAVSVRVRVDQDDTAVNAGIQFQGKQRAVYLSAGSSLKIVHIDKDNALRYVNDHVEPLEKRQEVVLTLVLAEGEYRFLVDGVEVHRVGADSDSLGVVSIYVAHGPARFDNIRVRRSQ